MNIVFRVDASNAMGSGHVIRCLTLADALCAAVPDAGIQFVCRSHPGNLVLYIEQRGYFTTCLPLGDSCFGENGLPHADWLGASQETDAAETQSAFRHHDIDWLIVDHYGIDYHWEQQLRSIVSHIVVLDDLANRKHLCDVLIDQNFVTNFEHRYEGLVPAEARVFAGPKFALLRHEFPSLRGVSRQRNGIVHAVLICFGGSDPNNHTLAVLEALRGYASSLERIDVVVGSSNPHIQSITAACETLSNAALHFSPTNIGELLMLADLAIGAGGGMNWERACLGVPSLVFGIAENQSSSIAALIEAGCVAGVSHMPMPVPQLIASWLSVLMNNPEFLRGLSRKSAELVDGQGTRRVVELMIAAPITFRHATVDDSENMRTWRNHPSVRGMSWDACEIDQATHEAWFRKALSDPQRILLVAECEGRAVGVVRFDLAKPDGVISVYRVPDSQGRGLIRQATDWFKENYPNYKRVIAEVLPNNHMSSKAFDAVGYRLIKKTFIVEMKRT